MRAAVLIRDIVKIPLLGDDESTRSALPETA
jgi:hypothetical protein